jgi:four helix bundle protein
MAKIEKFEDIQSWQKARILTLEIYKITSTEGFSKDFGLRDQIRRASVSIMANIAEGFGRKSNKDFAHFLVIAHASTAEVQSHLYVSLDLKYVEQAEFEGLYEMLDHISRLIMAFCKHLQS